LADVSGGPPRTVTWSTSPPASVFYASSIRCSGGASSSAGGPAHEHDRDDLDWYRPDGQPMTPDDVAPRLPWQVEFDTAAPTVAGSTVDPAAPLRLTEAPRP